jgi:hypothetical protein
VSGKLQEDPDIHSRAEPLDSAEAGDVDADIKDTDVEDVPNKPETDQVPDRSRSGNLDVPFGKRTLYTVTG